MKSDNEYDAIVIGAGNAGLAAAGVLRAAGKSVAILEKRDVGGTCPIRGCVPKKVLVAAAQTLDVISPACDHPIRESASGFDWASLIERERSFVNGVSGEIGAGLARRGIELKRGPARFVGPDAVAIA